MSFFRRVWLAWIVYAFLMIVFILFCGYFVSEDDIPAGLAWLRYLSPVNYGYQGFMNLYWGEVDVIECEDGDKCVARSGAEVLAYYSLRRRSALTDGLILLAINVAYRVIAYFALLWVRGEFNHRSTFTLSWFGRDSSAREDITSEENRQIRSESAALQMAEAASLNNAAGSHHHYIEVETPGAALSSSTRYTIQWRNLNLTVVERNLQDEIISETRLLRNVNGIAHPGELQLITGTSAAESKVLLECLGGRNA
ncbi:hypothetical protein PybrP1_002304, partial [[Pythium] brassicae (nom. inval.)]